MNNLNTDDIQAQGHGETGPGEGPDLSGYHLLAWSQARGVITEDGKLSLHSLAERVAPDVLDVDVALFFGTTLAHVRQARDYLAGH